MKIQEKGKRSRSFYNRIILKRINILFKRAIDVLDKDPALARRYIYILWKLKQKAKVQLPRNLRNKFCKKCFAPWVVGKTLRVRIRNGKIIYTCLSCGKVKRFKIRKSAVVTSHHPQLLQNSS
jgi:ribonuclease P protein subunit RPR2